MLDLNKKKKLLWISSYSAIASLTIVFCCFVYAILTN